MTKICPECGKKYKASGRRVRCPECAYARLKEKVRKRMYTVRRDLYGPLLKDRITYKVTAKCPRCPDGHDRHTVELEYKPHIMPRLFCPRHTPLKSLIYQDAYGAAVAI